jgi:uncharacterized protein (TIGR03382 family)
MTLATKRGLRLLGPAGTVLVGALATSVAAAPTEPGTLQNQLVPAQNCQNCHSFPNAMGHEDQPPYAPYFTWRGSLMANAARDPVFWAGVAIASQDSPGDTEDCIRCHAPRAFLEGRGDAIAMDQLTPEDLDGSVECEACHRMMQDPETVPGNALYTIDDVLDDGLVPRRGPWAYDETQNPTHSWLQDPWLGTSEMCGTCHDVTTHRERVDDDGQGMGMPFNEQRTYSEWLGSAFSEPGAESRSCQDCHMAAVADAVGCNDFVNVVTHPDGGRRHDMVGANRFVIELLRGIYGSEGSNTVNDFFWNLTLDRMDELLQTAATLEVQAPAEVDLGEGLEGLVITVTNETGHKLPTGYSEGRVMWLEIVATYHDETIFSSGRWDQAEGMQRDDQLRTYEGIAEDAADGAVFHLLRNNRWVVDSRIPPRGLRPDIETDPVGDRYTLQADGTWPHWDTVSYAFSGRDDVADATPADPTDDVLELRVRVLYLINTPEYVEFLADENRTNDAGNYVAMLFDTAGGAVPTVLAEHVVQIPITGFGASSTDTTEGDGGDPSGPSTRGETGTSTGDTEPTASDDDGGGGCGCTTSAPGHAPWLLLPVLAVGRRRRAVDHRG